MLNQKEVTIEVPDELGNEKKYTVVMKRLNYGEKVDLDSEAATIRIYNGVQDVKVDTAKMRILSILKSIVKTDYPNLQTWDAIRSMPQEVGDLLWETYTELNLTTLKKNE